MADGSATARRIRSAVICVAVANLVYFGVEFTVAAAINSVSLFADSVDFLEDAAVNLLVLLALGWSARARARVGILLAAVLLIPAVATVWTLWMQWHEPVVPAAVPLTLVGVGALVVNTGCAMLLARVRKVQSSLTRAAYLSARNDAYANVAIIVAAGMTAIRPTHWPDFIVGIGIFLMNTRAAMEVYAAARREDDEWAVRP